MANMANHRPFMDTTKEITSPDGTIIYAQALGDIGLPAIVFVHGQSMSSLVWDSVFGDPTWLKTVRLVRYDCRGFGRSTMVDTDAGFESRRIGEDFESVVAAFQLTHVFFAGWSLGATVLADICAHATSIKLLGAMYISGVPAIELIPHIAVPGILDLIAGMTSTDDVALSSKSVYKVLDMTVARQEKLPYRLRATWAGDAFAQPPSIRFRTLTRKQETAPLLQVASKSLPLLILHGIEDAQVDGEKVVSALKPAFGERLTEHWLPGVGHAPFLEEPEKFRDATLAFVESVMRAYKSEFAHNSDHLNISSTPSA